MDSVCIINYGLFVLNLYQAFHVQRGSLHWRTSILIFIHFCAPSMKYQSRHARGGGGVRRGEGATIKLWVVVEVGIIAAAITSSISRASEEGSRRFDNHR